MCLFPNYNLNFDSLSYRAGVRKFDCGACPECLQKRSASWALRAVYEAKQHVYSCMVTLTYDSFKYGLKGEIVGENPVDPTIVVSKKHVQDFIKRLRKKGFCTDYKFIDQNMKYIACAEYGSRTHRAHYHCLLFGVRFPDMSYYKRSKRGNPIYMSKILTDLWTHGICTIDCVNVHTAVARYCTKYCAKSRSENTFMLFSQSLGLKSLLQEFDGKSYFIDGREYPVPRSVWQSYISDKYKYFQVPFSYRYVNHKRDEYGYEVDEDSYLRAKRLRENYRLIRDRDDVYVDYISYWRSKSKMFEAVKPPVIARIYALDSRKFCNYKSAALRCFDLRKNHDIPMSAPGSKCVSRFNRYLLARGIFPNENGTYDLLRANCPYEDVKYYNCAPWYVRQNCGSDFVSVRFERYPYFHASDVLLDELVSLNGRVVKYVAPQFRKVFDDEDDLDVLLGAEYNLELDVIFSYPIHLPLPPRPITASDTQNVLKVDSEQLSYLSDIGI